MPAPALKLTPEERSAIARRAVATRRAHVAIRALEPLPPAPEPEPLPKRSLRCDVCERFEVSNGELWKCLGCKRRLCEHGMDPRHMHVNGTGYCRRCAWKRDSPAATNARLARLGLSPIEVKEEPEPSEFRAAA